MHIAIFPIELLSKAQAKLRIKLRINLKMKILDFKLGKQPSFLVIVLLALLLSSCSPTSYLEGRTQIGISNIFLPTRDMNATTKPLQANDRIYDLLATNGDCDYPCVWGIFPGQTTWNDAKSLFLDLGATIDYSDDTPVEQSDLASVYITSLPKEALGDFLYMGIELVVQDEIVKIISTYGFIGDRYTLHYIFNEYGMPDEIYLNTYYQYRDFHFMNLYLYYQERSLIVVVYDSSVEITEEGEIVGCYDPILELFTWRIDSQMTFQEISNTVFVYPLDWRAFHTLYEATGELNSDFYSRTSLTTGDVCVNTPRELWPLP
jgi:hypothetical protein